MRYFVRIFGGLAMAAAIGMLPALAAPSQAAIRVHPAITATQASFVIPWAGTWTLQLWSIESGHQTQVGSTTGTASTLTLPVPQTPSCAFQADARFTATAGQPSTWYSALVATVPGCGQSGTGQRYTPGYWKTHGTATAALLPVNLGSYVVSTSVQSTAVFDAMKCNSALDCLAGHLLGAVLDVASGSSICITGVIFQAETFLTKQGYQGPGSQVAAAQRPKAIDLANTLDSYTNDSTSASCS